MKLAVIYDSKTNNTAAVAGYMAEAMNSLEGVEAKTFLYSEVDTEFVKSVKALCLAVLLMQLVLHLIFIPGWRKMQAV